MMLPSRDERRAFSSAAADFAGYRGRCSSSRPACAKRCLVRGVAGACACADTGIDHSATLEYNIRACDQCATKFDTLAPCTAPDVCTKYAPQ